MYISGAEAAVRGLLLLFLVKVHAETKLLSQKRGAICFGTGERREGPGKNPGSVTCHRDVHGTILHCDGSTLKPIH